jgi:Tfp pilus assembly protein PilF
MRTLRPNLPPGWTTALAAEALAPFNPAAAREKWRAALAQAPDDPEILAGYAAFLTDGSESITEAEYLIRLALLKSPGDSAKAASLARLLLVAGRQTEGLQQLSVALSMALAEPAPAPDLLAELMFYLAAHDRARSREAMRTLKRLIAAGARCPGWNFEPTLYRAQDDGHSELALLRDIAKVLSHDSDPTCLNAHLAWKTA